VKFPIRTQRNRRPAIKVNCGRHDEAEVVVGVLPDQIYAAGSAVQARRASEDLFKSPFQTEGEPLWLYLRHVGSSVPEVITVATVESGVKPVRAGGFIEISLQAVSFFAVIRLRMSQSSL
jgi:hypothetical protein